MHVLRIKLTYDKIIMYLTYNVLSKYIKNYKFTIVFLLFLSDNLLAEALIHNTLMLPFQDFANIYLSNKVRLTLKYLQWLDHLCKDKHICRIFLLNYN